MNIQLAYNSVPSEPLLIAPAADNVRLVTPGQLINDDTSYMRLVLFHGFYLNSDWDKFPYWYKEISYSINGILDE